MTALDPDRLQSFALAYAPALAEVVADRRLWVDDMSPDDFIVTTTIDMVEAIKRAGVKGIEHYYVNTCGALARTCEALGIPFNHDSMATYLEGR